MSTPTSAVETRKEMVRRCIDELGARELLELQVEYRLAIAAAEGVTLSPCAAAREVAGELAGSAVGEVVSAVAFTAYRAENPGSDPLPRPGGIQLWLRSCANTNPNT